MAAPRWRAHWRILPSTRAELRLGPDLAFRKGMERTMPTARIARRIAVAALVLWAGSAQALSITGLSVATSAANTANASGTAGANRFQIASTAGLVGSAPGPVADVVGASVSFDARYAALLAADREAGGGTTSQSATAAYTITFTIDNPTGGAYRIDIDTSRVGALTLVNDSGGDGSASIGALLAFIDGAATPSLGLAAVGPLSGAAGGNQGFSQSSTTLSLFDTALTRTVTLAFSWSATASSSQDEAAVRLGIGGSLGTTTADDYPGVGGRVASGDGHLVGVDVTLLSVAEPSTLALLVLGLGGLAGWRRPAPLD
jgi:hypothetical protein